MKHLSICMPSHRNLEGSRRSIETALDYCAARDAVLVLSDNAEDPAKRAYWEGRSPNLHYVDAGNLDAHANFLSSINNASTEFVLMMGDDDEIACDPAIPAFDLAGLPQDHVGVRPMTHVWLPNRGVFRVKDFAIVDEMPGGRMLEYNAVAGGDNSAFYSIFRREPYSSLMQFFVDHHPTRGAYCDWAQVTSLFAYGKMAYDAGTIFKYNMDQWASSDLIDKKTISFYEDVGLPADGAKYHGLLLFLDVFVLVSRNRTPLTREGAINAIGVTAGSFFNSFLNQVKSEPDQYSETMRYLAEMAEGEMGAMERFHIGLLMAEEVKEGLKDRYVEFYKMAVAP